MTNIKIMSFDSSSLEINMFMYHQLSSIQVHIAISRENDKLPRVTGMWAETSNKQWSSTQITQHYYLAWKLL